MAEQASANTHVGGVTFKISVDTSAVKLDNLGQLHAQFSVLANVFERMAKNAAIVSNTLTRLARIERSITVTTEKLTKAKKKLDIATRQVVQAQQKYQKTIQALNQAQQTGAQNTQGFAQRMRGLATAAVAAASAFTGLRLGEFIKEATIYAGRVENLGTILHQVGTNANYTTAELDLYEKQVKKLGITTESARYSLTLLARNHLDLAKAARIARIAQDSAVIAGIDSSQANEKLAISIQRLDTRMLRNLGILVNLRNEYQRFALATGRVETSLTAYERQQILMNAVLRAGVNTVGTYEAAMQDAYKQYTSRIRLQKEATKEFGDAFQAVFSGAIELWSDFLKWFTALDKETKAAVAAFATFAAVTATVTAAVGALAFALMALGPAAIPIIAIATAVGFLTAKFFYATAQSAAFSKELAGMRQEYINLTTEAAHMRREFEQIEAIEKYAKTHELTAQQLDELERHYDNILVLLPRVRAEFEKLETAEEKLALLRRSIYGAGATTQQLINLELRKYVQVLERAALAVLSYRDSYELLYPLTETTVGSLEEIKSALDTAARSGASFEEMLSDLGMSTGWRDTILQMTEGVGLFADYEVLREYRNNTIEWLKTEYSLLQTHYAAVQTLQRDHMAWESRWLEERARAQETANQLALRVMNRLQEARAKIAKSSGVEILQDIRSYTRNLQDTMLTEEQILRKSANGWEQRYERITEAARKEKRDLGMILRGGEFVAPEGLSPGKQAEMERKRRVIDAEMEEDLRDARNALLEETTDLLLERQNILKASRAAREIIENEIKVREAEIRALNAETELIGTGADLGFVKTMERMEELLRGSAEAEKQIREKIFGTGDEEEIRQQRQQLDRLAAQGEILREQLRLVNKGTKEYEEFRTQLIALDTTITSVRFNLEMLTGGYKRMIELHSENLDLLLVKMRASVEDVAVQELIEIEMRGIRELSFEEHKRIEAYIRDHEAARDAYNALLTEMNNYKNALRELDDAERSLGIEREERLANWRNELAKLNNWLEEQTEDIETQEEELAEKRKQWAEARIELLGGEIRTLSDVRSELEKLQNAFYKNAKAVDEFLEKQKVEELDRINSGYKDMFETQKKFLDMIEKATSSEQLEQLREGLGEELRAQLQETREEMVELSKEYRDVIEDMLKEQQKWMMDPTHDRSRLIELERERRKILREYIELQQKQQNQIGWIEEAEKQAAEESAEQNKLLRERTAAYEEQRRIAEEQGRLEEFEAREKRRKWEEELHPMELEVRLLEEQQKLLEEELQDHEEKKEKLDEEEEKLQKIKSVVEEQRKAWVGTKAAIMEVIDALTILLDLEERGGDTAAATKRYESARKRAEDRLDKFWGTEEEVAKETEKPVEPLPGAGVRVENEDGTFSTERTVGVNIDGKEYVIPTLVNGEQLTIDEAVEHAREMGLENFPSFDSVEEAERYAKDRSSQLGRIEEKTEPETRGAGEREKIPGFDDKPVIKVEPEEVKPEEVKPEEPKRTYGPAKPEGYKFRTERDIAKEMQRKELESQIVEPGVSDEYTYGMMPGPTLNLPKSWAAKGIFRSLYPASTSLAVGAESLDPDRTGAIKERVSDTLSYLNEAGRPGGGPMQDIESTGINLITSGEQGEPSPMLKSPAYQRYLRFVMSGGDPSSAAGQKIVERVELDRARRARRTDYQQAQATRREQYTTSKEQKAAQYQEMQQTLQQQREEHMRQARFNFARYGRRSAQAAQPVPISGNIERDAAALAGSGAEAANGVDKMGNAAARGLNAAAGALDRAAQSSNQHAENIEQTAGRINDMNRGAGTIGRRYAHRGR